MTRFGIELLLCFVSFGAGMFLKGYLLNKAKAALQAAEAKIGK
jgi:hypothetical protein